MSEQKPSSAGPTAASPFGTASTNGAPPELSLPAATLKLRPSYELVVKKPTEMSPCELSTSVDGSASDIDSDLEEWVAEEDGGFSPRCEPGRGEWQPPTLSDLKPQLKIEMKRRVTRKPHVLWLLCILLGPQLSLLAYLCGVSRPSGSALTQSPPTPSPAPSVGQRPKGLLRNWRICSEARKEPPVQSNGKPYWLLPLAMWQHGVLLVPFLA
jgi:hypothetical protein